ncbi:hypothetical protein K435DRAFT_806279 [Dendrothele bispora CBS 962.96]|uniref:DUF6533 domain-containing protein n=1 Tax=Dendrothele bispora (strain CBS 962.96) TaxID=1314807 RepID=A0A4S8L938_DENBC|nr:hypothetical protein K435DRAFT_806279 [Dendrothele bispora CBS 962.96]
MLPYLSLPSSTPLSDGGNALSAVQDGRLPNQIYGLQLNDFSAIDTEMDFLQLRLRDGQTFLPITRCINFLAVASITFLLYDIILNFGVEVEFVWKSRWTSVKKLYLFTRYYGIFYNICMFVGLYKVFFDHVRTELMLDPSWLAVANLDSLPVNSLTAYQSCRGWFYYMVLGGPTIFGTSVYLILVMRVNALYQSKKVLVFLLSLWTASPAPPSLRTSGCSSLTERDFNLTLISWIISLAITLVFFPFSARKFIQEVHWKRETPFRKRLSGLMKTFFWDCFVLYSFFPCSGSLVARIVTTVEIENLSYLSDLLDGWHMAVYSFAAPRLVLHLRMAIRETCFTDIPEDQITFQGLVFAHQENTSLTVVEDND